MSPRSMTVRWLAVSLVLAMAALAAGAGRKGAVTVKLQGAAVGARYLRGVALVSGDTSEVLSVLDPLRKRQLVLRPEPGVYMAVASDVGARVTRTGVSKLFLVSPTRAAKAPMRVRKVRGVALAAAIARLGTARGLGGAGSGGPVLTMGGVPMTVGPGQTALMGDALLYGVFDSTHDAGARWVNSSDTFMDARQGYLDAQAAGRLDPTTPIHDNLIPPTQRVEGEMTLDANGHMTGEIRIVDANTGDVIARIPIDRPFDKDSADDLRKLWRDLSDEIIRAILERLLPSTTTTTSTTTTSTTTTSTTLTTTTTTTTSTTTTSTTTTTTTTTSAPTTSTTLFVPCGTGLLASAIVDYRLGAGVNATATGMTPQSDGRPSTPMGGDELGDTGGTDTIPYSFSVTVGATATANGSMSWTVAPCQITSSGTFHEESTGGSVTSASSTDLDASVQVRFKVKALAPYFVTGSVRASGTATTSAPLDAYLKCFLNQVLVADGNLQNPSGSSIPFTAQSTLHPSDEAVISCAVDRGGSSTVFGDDDADLSWDFTVTLGN